MLKAYICNGNTVSHDTSTFLVIAKGYSQRGFEYDAEMIDALKCHQCLFTSLIAQESEGEVRFLENLKMVNLSINRESFFESFFVDILRQTANPNFTNSDVMT